MVEDGQRIGNAYCGNPAYIKKEDNCTEFFDEAKFKSFYNTKCLHKKTCLIDLTDNQWFMPNISAKCLNPETRIYFQTTCQLKNSEMSHDKTVAIIATFLVLTISSCFYERVREFQRNQKLDKAKYDIQNVTITDYTVRINGLLEWYDEFLKIQDKRIADGEEPQLMT